MGGLQAERVLIDRDQVVVRQDGKRGGRRAADVVPRDQRRGHHRPHGEMASLLGFRHAAVADLQHVRVVEPTRLGVGSQRHVDVDDVLHAHECAAVTAGVPLIRNVLSGPPYVRDVTPVAPWSGLLVNAVGVDAVDDLPSGGGQGVAHLGERRHLLLHRAVGRAPVVLEEVDPPCREPPGVLLLVASAAGGAGEGVEVLRTCLVHRHLINAEFQASAVNVVSKRLHPAREPGRMRLEITLSITVGIEPAVVHHDVLVAPGGHPVGDQRVDRLPDQGLGDVAAERVPGVPPHRRGAGPLVLQCLSRARGEYRRGHSRYEQADDRRHRRDSAAHEQRPDVSVNSRTRKISGHSVSFRAIATPGNSLDTVRPARREHTAQLG